MESSRYLDCSADFSFDAHVLFRVCDEKRITSTLLKDLDTVARNAIREELASLDPLLRNISSEEGTKAMYEFEGI